MKGHGLEAKDVILLYDGELMMMMMITTLCMITGPFNR